MPIGGQCPESLCEWRGEPPYCDNILGPHQCKHGYQQVGTAAGSSSETVYPDFGADCLFGRKIYCCQIGSCLYELNWALGTGINEYQHFYDNFENVTGTILEDAILSDMILYFYCMNIHTDSSCAGLTPDSSDLRRHTCGNTNFESLGTNTVCMVHSTSDPSGYELIHMDLSRFQCLQSCENDSNCSAIEYSLNRCEIWYNTPIRSFTQAVSGYECILKICINYKVFQAI